MLKQLMVSDNGLSNLGVLHFSITLKFDATLEELALRGLWGSNNLARSLAQPAKWETCWRMLLRAESADGASYF